MDICNNKKIRSVFMMCVILKSIFKENRSDLSIEFASPCFSDPS